LTKVITKGTTPQTIKRQYMLSGTPFLRAENLQGGDIVLGEGTLFIDNITHNMLERSVIYPNDILLSIAGTIGRGAIVPEGSEEMNCNQAVAIIRPMLDLVEPRFLLAWLQSDIAQFQMGGAKVTQTIANLALGQIKQFKLRVPPMSLQKEFAQRVAEIHELEATQSQSRQRLDNLFQSLLHRAFNGEL
jgi:type I restriction enzyme, S subunit